MKGGSFRGISAAKSFKIKNDRVYVLSDILVKENLSYGPLKAKVSMDRVFIKIASYLGFYQGRVAENGVGSSKAHLLVFIGVLLSLSSTFRSLGLQCKTYFQDIVLRNPTDVQGALMLQIIGKSILHVHKTNPS